MTKKTIEIQEEEIKAEQLIHNVLKLLDKQIKKLASQEDDLSEDQLSLLPGILRVLISAKRSDKQEEEEIKGNISTLTTEQLKELLK